MSRKTRRRHNAHPAQTAPQAEPAAYFGTTTYGNYGSNFSAARPSEGKRGTILWSTLDTDKESSPTDRWTLIAKSRALFWNTPIARVLVLLAKRVGSQRPQAATTDRVWNAACEEAFNTYAGSELSVDLRRQNSFFGVQPLMELLALRDGLCYVIFTKSKAGRAQFAIFEAHRCKGTPEGQQIGQNGWQDGIQLNENGAPINYWFVDPADATKGKLISAYFVHVHTYRLGMETNPLPALTPVILDIQDMIETKGFLKAKLKATSMFGVVITSDPAAPGPERPALGNLKNGQTPFRTTTGTPATGTPTADTATTPTDNGPRYEEIDTNQAGNSLVALAPGQKPETISDPHPSTEHRQFTMDLQAGVAIALNLPPNYLFYLDKTTGPMTEQQRNQADMWIKDRQDNMRRFLNRFYAYAIACDEKANLLTGTEITLDIDTGRIATSRSRNLQVVPLNRPINWWRVNWQRPAGLASNHEGRNLAVEVTRYQEGLTTLSAIFEEDGLYWEDQVLQREEETSFLLTSIDRLAQRHPNHTPELILQLMRKGSTFPLPAPEPAPQNPPA